MKNNVNREVEKEAIFGIIPILQNEKLYGFLDAFLILSGYCIAHLELHSGVLSGNSGGL